MTTDDEFLPFALPDVTEAEISAVVETMRGGWLTTGPITAAFEADFAAFLEAEGIHTVAVNSATAGLHLALEALGIGPGDEVLVPVWTFTATAEVVRYLGATPVFVDVDPVTLNINLHAASSLVTPRTKVVMPVHFAGLPVDRAELRNFAEKHKIAVVEDAAHAFPVRSSGRWIGDSESDAVVFSFYATKTITTGEGGMLVTRDAALAQRARTMRLHGINRDIFDRYSSPTPSWHYSVIAPGFKYNMPDIAAAIGRVQLGRALCMRGAREAIAEKYFEQLNNLPLELPERPTTKDGHSWHLYPVRLTNAARDDRDHTIEQLSRRGIGASVHFIPLHMQPYWRETYGLADTEFPVASSAFQSIISLPCYSSMTRANVDRVASVMHQILVEKE